MALTRRAFNRIARDLGLNPLVHSRSSMPRRFVRTAFSHAPQVGVDSGRNVAASDAFLAAFDAPAAVYTLGHEAGHVVHEHWKHGRREIAYEIQADMWGILALDAYGYSRHVAAETLSAMRALYPDIDHRGEITARLAALEFVTSKPADSHVALAFVSSTAPAMHPLTLTLRSLFC